MDLNNFCGLLKKEILKNESIIILPHVSADGDAIGSALALGYLIKKFGRDVRVVLEEKAPDKYSFFTNSDMLEVFKASVSYDADIYIAVDTGDINRLGKRKELFSGSNTWNIDHHRTNNEFARNNYVDMNASSTGEIIYDFFKCLDYEVDKRTAEALFTAISTDTGGLRYSNTTPKCMRICADLLETGIDISEISHKSFDMMPYPKVLLTGVAIDNLELFYNGKLALIILKKSEYEFLEGKDEYFDGIVNLAINTEGVMAGVLVRENGERNFKVNLRSASDAIDVSLFAGINKGGGHIRAAGFTENSKNMNELKKYILDYFGEILDRI